MQNSKASMREGLTDTRTILLCGALTSEPK